MSWPYAPHKGTWACCFFYIGCDDNRKLQVSKYDVITVFWIGCFKPFLLGTLCTSRSWVAFPEKIWKKAKWLNEQYPPDMQVYGWVFFSFAHPWRIEREHYCAMNTLAGMVKTSCQAVKSKSERLSWFGPRPMGCCLGLILHLCHHCGLAWWVLVALGHHPALLPCWMEVLGQGLVGETWLCCPKYPPHLSADQLPGSCQPSQCLDILVLPRESSSCKNNRLQMGKDCSPSKISTASQLTQSIYWSR